MEIGKTLTGERLIIHASGNRAEIDKVMHGQADEIARQFRALKEPGSQPAVPSSAPEPDVWSKFGSWVSYAMPVS